MANNWRALFDDSDSEGEFLGFKSDDNLVQSRSSVSLDLEVSDVSDVSSSESEDEDDDVFDGHTVGRPTCTSVLYLPAPRTATVDAFDDAYEDAWLRKFDPVTGPLLHSVESTEFNGTNEF